MSVISLDTETTGIDFNHGVRPFFVTSTDDKGETSYWEWDVEPTSRVVGWDHHDLAEIVSTIRGADRLVLQNGKFDYHALRHLYRDAGTLSRLEKAWDWDKVDDTLVAGHVLASNQPHDLTSMAMHYLGVDIEPLEKKLHDLTEECRRWCRGHRPHWRIAKSGLSDMPSAKEKCWKYDTWLPRAVADEEEVGEEARAEYSVCLRDYANADSGVTLALWWRMEEELRKRKLWDIYRCRMKVIPVVVGMEAGGVTCSKKNLDELRAVYSDMAEDGKKVCENIARNMGFELTLPKSGNNQALVAFVQSPDGLNIQKEGSPTANEKTVRIPRSMWTEKGNLSLDKRVMEFVEAELTINEPRGKRLAFVKSLRDKRKKDTSLAYLDGYERFWLPYGNSDDEGWFQLFQSLNPTGTDTLRFSSSNPNVQNISKGEVEGQSLRCVFGPAPGREWWSLDAKNIEARLPAYESGEQELIDLYERPDDPPYYGSAHLLNFHTVYPDIWDKECAEVGIEKVGPHCKKKYAATWYQWCKNGGFAIQYGAGEATTDKAFHKKGAYYLLKVRFSKLERLNQKCIQMANKLGYVETIPDRSVDPKRGYPILCTRTQYGSVLPTVPLNYHIQGTAMWWTMKAMIRVEEQLRQWRQEGFDGRLVLQVHDELVFDFPKRTHPSVVKDLKGPETQFQRLGSNLWRIRVIQQLMAQGGEDIGIPTPVSVEYHTEHWGKGETV